MTSHGEHQRQAVAREHVRVREVDIRAARHCGKRKLLKATENPATIRGLPKRGLHTAVASWRYRGAVSPGQEEELLEMRQPDERTLPIELPNTTALLP